MLYTKDCENYYDWVNDIQLDPNMRKSVATVQDKNNIYYADRLYKIDSRIEYLESTGTQYIKLDYIPKGSDIIETKVRCTSLTCNFTTQTQYPLFNPIFGVQISTSHKFWSAFVKNSSNNYYQLYYYNTYNNGNNYTSYTPNMSSATEVLQWYELIYNKKTLFRNRIACTPSNEDNGVSVSPDLQYPIYLFYVNPQGSISLSGVTSKLQIAYFRIKNSNNEILVDLIPVRIGSIGYMYDRVNHKLYGNEGTGTFICGPNIESKYDSKVEYLESTGYEFIDTGFIPNDQTGFYTEMKRPSTAGDFYFFGFKETSGHTRICYGASPTGWYFGWNVYGPGSGNDRVKDLRVKLWLNWKNNRIHKEYGLESIVTKSGPIGTLAFTPTTKIYIFMGSFSNNLNFVSISSKYTNGLKIYSFKISQGNKIVMDMIPVRKNGIGYLYDKVSDKLFGNSNNIGTFRYGPDIRD